MFGTTPSATTTTVNACHRWYLGAGRGARNLRRVAVATGLGLASAAGSLLTAAPPAHAAPATCGAAGYYCFFVRPNFTPTGSGYRIRFASTSFDNFSNYPAAEGRTGTFHDNVESMANTGSRYVCVYNNGRRVIRSLPGVDVANYTSNNNTFDYWRATTGDCPAS